MKRLFSTFIIILAAVMTSVNASTLAQQADSAYMLDDFTEAANLYQQSIATDGVSSDIYYNLGNTYYRMGQPGRAILYYERALKLDPRNSEARQNLAFVNSKIVDEPGDRGSVMSKIVTDTVNLMSSNAWAWVGFSLFVVFLGAIATYIFSSNITMRKVSFFGGLIVLVVMVCAIVLSSIGASRAVSHDEAVVTSSSSQLSTSPRVPKSKTEEAMLLHEGTKVEILDSVANPRDSINSVWYDVRVDNSHRAWISSKDIEKI